MKPLILILLVSVSVEAQGVQGVVDAARQERARQARASGARVFTDANSHTLDSLNTPAKPAKAEGPAASATAAAAAPADKSSTSPADDQTQKLRLKVRALEDQETGLKLQINDITNQVYAPVTDQATRTAAQNKLGEAQSLLADLQKDLAQTRTDLQKAEADAQAAPKK